MHHGGWLMMCISKGKRDGRGGYYLVIYLYMLIELRRLRVFLCLPYISRHGFEHSVRYLAVLRSMAACSHW